MSICSIKFLLFTGAVLLVYYLLPARVKRLQPYILLSASLVFYWTLSAWASAYLLLAAMITYGAALLMARRPQKRRLWLTVDLLAVLGLLIVLKYHAFINYSVLGGRLSALESGAARFLLLPAGISFYTLSAAGYAIDVYRGKYPPEKSFFRFLLFVAWFPHILQGPIARFHQLSPQLSQPHSFDWDAFNMGLQRMLWGYLKKLVIADRAAVFVRGVSAHSAVTGGTVLFIASLLYTVQLYADFSGCVDILCGVSELFGIRLSDNFRQPFFSRSLGELWRRWHISLSSWFRDYLYIPLGGNRRGRLRRYANTLIVFLVSGFWHGAGWNYLVWGAINGVWLVLEDWFYRVKLRKRPEEISPHLAWLQMLVTFLLWVFAIIVFMNDSLRTALKVLRNILLRPNLWALGDGTLFRYGLGAPEMTLLLLFVALLIGVDVLNSRGISVRGLLAEQPLPVRWVVLLLGVLAVFLFGVYGLDFDAGSFIYMGF